MPDRHGERLDRIERVLELAMHTIDYLSTESKNLLRAQVIMQDRLDKMQQESREREKRLDERLDRLVSAIGALAGLTSSTQSPASGTVWNPG